MVEHLDNPANAVVGSSTVTVEALQRAIDPEAWAARPEDQRIIGQWWDCIQRRERSEQAARRVHAFLAEHRIIEVR